MKKNVPSSTSRPRERSAPSQCASRGALRHFREGGEVTTARAPTTPIRWSTFSAAASDQSATIRVTISGPTT